jgi:sigma-B regulation protein RsbU (phosphoserine phosphatase)
MELSQKTWPTAAQVRLWWQKRSAVTRLAFYFVAIDLLLLVLWTITQVLKLPAGSLDSWVVFLAWASGLLLVFAGLRWVRRKLLWRLRNRLFVTYVFIGVIPVVLLVAMGVISGYLFAGQFATFVATSDLQSELRLIETVNARLAAEMASGIRAGVPPPVQLRHTAEQLRRTYPRSQLAAWLHGKPVGPDRPSFAPPPENSEQRRWLARDSNGLWLRAASTQTVASGQLTLVSSVPMDSELLGRLAAGLGQVSLSWMSNKAEQTVAKTERKSGLQVEGKAERKPTLRIGDEQFQLEGGDNSGTVTAGTLAAPANRYDRSVSFLSTVPTVEWTTGQQRDALLTVHTRLSLLYGRLFRTIGRFADVILAVLAGIAIFFAVIELVALFVGVRLTRTVTRSVAALYNGTQHVNQGELTHRIEVKSNDQLAELERSFNSMTESLQKLIEEQKQKQRLESELAIAQEVQAQLFPKESSDLSSLEIHGFCRPARTVSGDYYDFLPLGPDKLGIAVGDISGKGISAALLMATIHSAVRVYELGRVPDRRQLMAAGAAAIAAGQEMGISSLSVASGIESPAEVMWLLNRHLYHSTPAEKYATLFLGMYEAAQRKLTYCNAGHLPPIIIGHDGCVRKLDAGGMVIGLFDNMQYEERAVELHPGDIFIAYSDGVTEPENEFGEFGEERLLQLVRENRHLPLARISEEVTAAVMDWIGANEQPDDITLVLARAR